jgi:hypothetical protein
LQGLVDLVDGIRIAQGVLETEFGDAAAKLFDVRRFGHELSVCKGRPLDKGPLALLCNQQEARLRELRRVALGPVVIVTCDPEVVAEMWLYRDYLPEAAALDRALASFWATPSAFLTTRHAGHPDGGRSPLTGHASLCTAHRSQSRYVQCGNADQTRYWQHHRLGTGNEKVSTDSGHGRRSGARGGSLRRQ